MGGQKTLWGHRFSPEQKKTAPQCGFYLTNTCMCNLDWYNVFYRKIKHSTGSWDILEYLSILIYFFVKGYLSHFVSEFFISSYTFKKINTFYVSYVFSPITTLWFLIPFGTTAQFHQKHVAHSALNQAFLFKMVISRNKITFNMFKPFPVPVSREYKLYYNRKQGIWSVLRYILKRSTQLTHITMSSRLPCFNQNFTIWWSIDFSIVIVHILQTGNCMC